MTRLQPSYVIAGPRGAIAVIYKVERKRRGILGKAVMLTLAFYALLIAAALAAGVDRPMPVPSTGGFPSGYSYSPTSSTCSPIAGTRCRAFPSSGSCPTGWTYSPTSRMCTETRC
jgi:hypothetical protein